MYAICANGPIPGHLIILYSMTFEHWKYMCLWLKQLVECPLCSLCLQMLTYCPVDGTLRHYALPSQVIVTGAEILQFVLSPNEKETVNSSEENLN